MKKHVYYLNSKAKKEAQLRKEQKKKDTYDRRIREKREKRAKERSEREKQEYSKRWKSQLRWLANLVI